MDINGIKYIGFDADDTLWVNEPNYQSAERKYCELLSEYSISEKVSEELYKTEKQNLELYGFGVKSFTLSMIENAIKISDGRVRTKTLLEIINLGRDLIKEPVELLDGVEMVLEKLYHNYKLLVATKGDLLDQERKLNASGLNKYFHHIEIMSDKNELNYQRLFDRLEIKADEFVMIGNSLRSDIIPVINLGAMAIYIPYHTTWQHEIIRDDKPDEQHYHKINSIRQLMEIFLNDKKD